MVGVAPRAEQPDPGGLVWVGCPHEHIAVPRQETEEEGKCRMEGGGELRAPPELPEQLLLCHRAAPHCVCHEGLEAGLGLPLTAAAGLVGCSQRLPRCSQRRDPGIAGLNVGGKAKASDLRIGVVEDSEGISCVRPEEVPPGALKDAPDHTLVKGAFLGFVVQHDRRERAAFRVPPLALQDPQDLFYKGTLVGVRPSRRPSHAAPIARTRKLTGVPFTYRPTCDTGLPAHTDPSSTSSLAAGPPAASPTSSTSRATTPGSTEPGAGTRTSRDKPPTSPVTLRPLQAGAERATVSPTRGKGQ
eukprot:Sspe_Gene.48023::Locus_24745_Transcript_1_1_Confidence_1.000_Length_1746::g.48023::m.48023